MKKNSENQNTQEEKQKISVKERLHNLSFYKEKRFYTILIIVFSVLLIATVVTGPLARMGSAFAGLSSFGQMESFDADEAASEDTSSDDASSEDASGDASSSDDSSFGGSAPDMDSGDMSSGGLPSGSLPDSSDSSSSDEGSFDISEIADGDLPEGDSSLSDISEGGLEDFAADGDEADTGDAALGGIASAGAQSSSSGGFISWYGSSWRIIALILLILDAAAIVCRIMTAKRQKKEARQALKEQAKQEGRVYIDKGPEKKERNAKTAWIIPLCVVIAIILIVNLISSGGSQTAAQTEASDLSGTVETGTIATTVPGTGTLESADAVDLSYADGVTVTKWYVSNGDTVSEGDTLAKVDKTTVLSAIATVQEAIEAIDEEIASHEDDEISDTITASSDGRVKAVYAAEGTSVVDTMYENGSLIIISLDGLMAVDIETDSLSRGDAVTVTLSDGTEEEGEVESVTNSVAVITLTDEGTDIGDTVTVTDADGNEIGTGELYVHSALKITGFSGTVSDISVSEEDEVSSGDTLLTLEDTDYTAEYEALIETRTELSDQIASLFTLYATGYLYASSDGIISGIDESLTDDTSDDSSDEDSSSEDTSQETDSDDTASADATSLKASSSDISVLQVDLVLTSDSTDEDDASDTSDADSSGTADDASGSTDSETEESTDTETSSVSESIVGYVTALTSNDDGSVTLTVLTTSSETKEVTLSSADTVYTFSDLAFASASLSDIQTGYLIFYDAGNSQVIYISLSTSSSDQSEDQGQEDAQSESGQYSEGQSDSSSSLSDMLSGSDTSSDMTSSGTDASSLLTTDTSTTGDVSTTDEAVEATYSVSETVLCSITPQDYMTVEITVDELDILSLSAGQSAVVTLDAYAGQSFEGEVISVSLSPTNSGGNSKYTAVIQIEKTEDMLSGMNASVSITIDETDDVLIIPAAAVFEEDGAYYVYTSFDEKSGEYSGAVEVTLGVSDGEYVEVTSGLSEGDAYYYSYLDTVNYSSTTITGSGSLFSFGGM